MRKHGLPPLGGLWIVRLPHDPDHHDANQHGFAIVIPFDAHRGCGSESSNSPAKSVNLYNQHSVLSLLACPLDVQSNLAPLDQQYFYTYPFVQTSYNKNIAGDACDVPPGQSSITSNVDLDTKITWSNAAIANAVVQPLAVDNLGSLWISMLSYSPMVQYGSENIISNGYATNSYAFVPIPSLAQHAIWTWNARFADLSGKTVQDSLQATTSPTITKTFAGGTGAGSTSAPASSYTCTYSYDYTEKTTLQNIANAYIPFNEVIAAWASGEAAGLRAGPLR